MQGESTSYVEVPMGTYPGRYSIPTHPAAIYEHSSFAMNVCNNAST